MKDNESQYEYELLNYWNDNNDLYVNYIVSDINNNQKVNSIAYYNTSDIDINNDEYDEARQLEIRQRLLNLLKQNKGIEFKLPKISEASPLLCYIYDTVWDSDSNMCHIDFIDWDDLQKEEMFTAEDFNTLIEEIKKYKLEDYITINVDGYKICGYGGLQCMFNDDRKFRERTDSIER